MSRRLCVCLLTTAESQPEGHSLCCELPIGQLYKKKPTSSRVFSCSHLAVFLMFPRSKSDLLRCTPQYRPCGNRLGYFKCKYVFMVPQTLNFSPLLTCLNSRNTNTNIHTNSSAIQEADEVASYYCITLTRCYTTPSGTVLTQPPR